MPSVAHLERVTSRDDEEGLMQDRNDAQQPLWVTVGVDTHLDTHTAAAVDPTGRTLQWRTFTADAGGYAQLLTWAIGFGPVPGSGSRAPAAGAPG